MSELHEIFYTCYSIVGRGLVLPWQRCRCGHRDLPGSAAKCVSGCKVCCCRLLHLLCCIVSPWSRCYERPNSTERDWQAGLVKQKLKVIIVILVWWHRASLSHFAAQPASCWPRVIRIGRIHLQAGLCTKRPNPGLVVFELKFSVVLLRYPKPTPKPRFFAKTVHRRNLGFSAIIDGFLGLSAC